MSKFLFLIGILLLSVYITSFIRKYFLRKAILDIPNERSSHTMPTPRGGGIAVAFTFFLGVLYYFYMGVISFDLMMAILGGGIIIALVGYLDDLYSISARNRALCHAFAAGWALYWLGGFATLDIGFWQVHLGWLGTLLALVGIVWVINLYNFMDGIDGLAGSEAVFVSLVMGGLLWAMHIVDIASLCFLLAAATAGFLIWNWPPAKIFLGDVGSGLLGFVFAVLAIASANQHMISITNWIILLGVFIFDATFTLIHRIWRKEQWYSAHREHIYQRLIQKGASHKQVTIWITVFNLGILFPLVMISCIWKSSSLLLFIFTGILFGLLWIRLIALNKSRCT